MNISIKYSPTIKIENIVATASINKALDFNYIEKSVPNVEYDPDKFPGLIFRLDDPKITALIFKTGKMVITGARTINELIEGVKGIVKALKSFGLDINEKPKVQIQNIVASANLHLGVNLEKAAFVLENSMYEPEQFPGLIYRLNDPKVVLLIFTSGKIVITGARREEYIPTAVKKIFDILVEKECVYPIEEEEEEIEI